MKSTTRESSDETDLPKQGSPPFHSPMIWYRIAVELIIKYQQTLNRNTLSTANALALKSLNQITLLTKC